MLYQRASFHLCVLRWGIVRIPKNIQILTILVILVLKLIGTSQLAGSSMAR